MSTLTVSTAVTVDLLIFTVSNKKLEILLIKRGIEPYKDMWALPGGFVLPNESLEEAAIRELSEETGVEQVYLEQLYTFGDVNRDPRKRVITVAYFALLAEKPLPHASSDAKDAKWVSIDNLPKLAFDHEKILDYAITRLRNKIQYSSLSYALLPENFSLTELQEVHEIILNKKLDKRNFRKWILSTKLLKKVNSKKKSGAYRPAELFSFAEKKPVIFK